MGEIRTGLVIVIFAVFIIVSCVGLWIFKKKSSREDFDKDENENDENNLEFQEAERRQDVYEAFKKEQFSSAIFSSVLDSIVVINSRGLINSCNPATEKLLGYQAHELVGKNVSILMPKEYATKHDVFLKNYLNTGEAKIIGIGREVPCKKKDGTFFTAELSVSSFNVQDEVYFVGSLRDVSERKDIEEKLSSAVKKAESAANAKNLFLANMSHELRTPLNSIIGMADVLKETALNDDQYRYLNMIHNGGRKLLSLIQDVLDLSKLEAEEVEIETNEVNLHRLVEETVEGLVLKASAANINLQCTVDSQIEKFVLTDALRLGQVLTNLLNNALKFTENGEVVLQVKKKENNYTFEVVDNGIGISQEKLKSLFMPFKQASVDTTRKYGGTGLGLFISKSLVKLLGGELQVKSREGVGSNFFFTLPLEEKGVINNNGINLKEKILFVSDNSLNRSILNTIISNYKIPCAVKGEAEYQSLTKKGRFSRDLFIVFLCNQEKVPKMFLDLMKAGHPVDKLIVGFWPEESSEYKNKLVSTGVKNFVEQPILRKRFFKQIDGVIKRISEKKEDVSAANVKNIAIVDDDMDVLRFVKASLENSSLNIYCFDKAVGFKDSLSKMKYDLVISDSLLPVMTGSQLFYEFRKMGQQSPFLMITAAPESIEKEILSEVLILEKPLSKDKIRQLAYDVLRIRPDGDASELPSMKNGPVNNIPNLKILAVDDSEENRDVIEIYLQNEKIDLAMAEDGVVALEKIKEFQPDLIFMDLQMPNMNGIECVKKIRSELKSDVFTVALSANVGEEEERLALASGCDMYLTKPISKAKMLEVIGKRREHVKLSA